MSPHADRIPGQRDVNEVLELVVRDKRHPEPVAPSGELVAPADELVEAIPASSSSLPRRAPDATGSEVDRAAYGQDCPARP